VHGVAGLCAARAGYGKECGEWFNYFAWRGSARQCAAGLCAARAGYGKECGEWFAIQLKGFTDERI